MRGSYWNIVVQTIRMQTQTVEAILSVFECIEAVSFSVEACDVMPVSSVTSSTHTITSSCAVDVTACIQLSTSQIPGAPVQLHFDVAYSIHAITVTSSVTDVAFEWMTLRTHDTQWATFGSTDTV